MAAVQNDEQGAVGRQVGDEVLMQNVAVDLAAGLEVVGNYGVEEAGGTLAGGVADLTACEEGTALSWVFKGKCMGWWTGWRMQ